MDSGSDARAAMIDLAYSLHAPDALQGGVVSSDYRALLAAAIEARLPWLAETPGAGIHRLNLVPGGAGQMLMSKRTRLVLRVPRDRLAEARALEGATLVLDRHELTVGPLQVRELLPWGTLYAHLVAADAVGDEAAFMRQVDEELRMRSVPCRAICGRRQMLEAGALQGYSLMLDGLAATDSLRMLERGIGRHRRLGCGLFVPHKSAAAVGPAP